MPRSKKKHSKESKFFDVILPKRAHITESTIAGGLSLNVDNPFILYQSHCNLSTGNNSQIWSECRHMHTHTHIVCEPKTNKLKKSQNVTAPSHRKKK